jgi:hypothetical protein
VGFLFADIETSLRDLALVGEPDYKEAAFDLTREIALTLLTRCRVASSSLQTWTAASRRCEEWVGVHDRELRSLDELLPIADGVPLPLFAPVPRPWAR